MSILSRLWPEEWLAWAFLVVVAATFAIRGYPFTIAPLLVSYFWFLLSISLVVLPAGLSIASYRYWKGLRTWAPPRALLLGFLRSLAALLVILIPYTNLKCRLLLFHSRLFDAVFARLDNLLHMGGGDFVAWVASWHAPTATFAAYLVYFFAWAALALPLAVALARQAMGMEQRDWVRQTLAALGIAYLAGVLLYLALPSLGPALVHRERYSGLAGTGVFTMQGQMLEALRHIVQNPTAPAIPFFGLAAFPSLHLATSSLGIILAWRTWRPLLVLLVPWNLAIAASAIYFGWHYVVDFYPALLLAWGSWWVANSLVGKGLRAGETSESGAPTPSA